MNQLGQWESRWYRHRTHFQREESVHVGKQAEDGGLRVTLDSLQAQDEVPCLLSSQDTALQRGPPAAMKIGIIWL